MKNLVLLILLVASSLISRDAFTQGRISRLESALGGWVVDVDEGGAITKLQMPFNGQLVNIPWRTDRYAGPSWEGVFLAKVEQKRLWFEGRKGDIIYAIEYLDKGGKLAIVATLQNAGPTAYVAQPHTRLSLGIDNDMNDPKAYFGSFFPTLLRSEKTHFWGYFQSPNGNFLSISSPDPVASWKLGYIGSGHRIATSYLDLMHTLPLPKRHPQHLTQLAPGEKRSWEIILQPVVSLDEVLPAISVNCEAPAIGIDRTTVAPGETVELTIYNGQVDHKITITDAGGKVIGLPKPQSKNNNLVYVFPAPETVGDCAINVAGNSKSSEASIHVRNPWGWYMKQARSEALRMQIKPMQHREGWMGFMTAYLAHAYFPDAQKLAETETIFKNFYALMVDSAKVDFYEEKPTWSTRPQNTSWMIDLLNARYAATRKVADLELAANWADHFIEKFQLPNGAFKGYTALTLGSKFLQDLLGYERPFALKDPVWRERYNRHLTALEKATTNIFTVKDMGDTEGEATYEDTQAGSAWSLLGMHALNTNDPAKRDQFLKASLAVQARHQCLTQALIPDSRMRGATLRFWETQYDVLTAPDMMNSPHGWTMRSQFGALYLYLLTGEERFLLIANNAMGTCAQAIDEKTGTLRWAFVPDPYVEAQAFVPDPMAPGKGKRVPKVIGEQWLPMISDWWRVPDGEIGRLIGHNQHNGLQNVSQGWSCDNDVHMHFITMADEFVPNAFVLEREDGTFRAVNCRIEQKGNTMKVIPAEDVVTRVHFNVKKKQRCTISFSTGAVNQTVEKGLHWVGPGVKSSKISNMYVGDIISPITSTK